MRESNKYSRGQVASAIWFQEDAAYLYREAEKARDSGKPASEWIATRTQQNAAHSAKAARKILGIE